MELSKTVLATIDKDIKMCAGKFINPDQDLGIEEMLNVFENTKVDFKNNY